MRTPAATQCKALQLANVAATWCGVIQRFLKACNASLQWHGKTALNMAFFGMWVGHTVRGEQRLKAPKAFFVPAAPLLRTVRAIVRRLGLCHCLCKLECCILPLILRAREHAECTIDWMQLSNHSIPKQVCIFINDLLWVCNL